MMDEVIIKCDYKLRTGKWQSFLIKYSEFFDIDETNKSATIFDMTPKFFLDPCNYVPHPKEKIEFLSFKIKDIKENSIQDNYTFWNGGRNQIREYVEFIGNKVSYRTITQFVFLDNMNYLLLRMEERDGYLYPITNSIYNSETDELVG